MSGNKEEAGLAAALGNTPEQRFDRAFNCTVTIPGTGIGEITVDDVLQLIFAQHKVANITDCDQMYIHEIRAYGTAGGFLSMAPYPHKQYCGFQTENQTGTSTATMWNSYSTNVSSAGYRSGTITQMYEFGISGSTRPHVKWTYPKTEVLNNPFIINTIAIEGRDAAGTTDNQFVYPQTSRVCTVQSTNTGGNALYLLQIDVTIRSSSFVEIAPSLGAAGFGEENVMVDHYKPSKDSKKRQEEGEKAEKLANKKRKVKSVKD